jgi:hypothetical protein
VRQVCKFIQEGHKGWIYTILASSITTSKTGGTQASGIGHTLFGDELLDRIHSIRLGKDLAVGIMIMLLGDSLIRSGSGGPSPRDEQQQKEGRKWNPF